uniref:Uncharacterized protein n=1 Tax=Bracon brevicornis TaxID=1563983 RepID=A0A6V7JQF3_9HYME
MVTAEVLLDSEQLGKFWIQETMPEVTRYYTIDEQFCEQYFKDTATKDSTGRFTVRLPLRPEISLRESRQIAIKGLHAIERTFIRNRELAGAYAQFMDDYLQQRHMTFKDTTTINTE